VTEIDNLRGDEPYKRKWTPKRRERRGILVFNGNMKGMCLAFLMIRVAPFLERRNELARLKRKISQYLRNESVKKAVD
jgi:hypothetical protein